MRVASQSPKLSCGFGSPWASTYPRSLSNMSGLGPKAARSKNQYHCCLSDAHATEYYVTTYRHALYERQQWY